MLTLRELTRTELPKAYAIDVAETGDVVYTYADGEFHARPEAWRRPTWNAEQWQRHLDDWINVLHLDVALGVFDGDRLTGLATLRYRLTATMAQLVSLHVDQAYRRQGVATRLVQEVIRLAQESGAQALYVSATPSASALGFYTRQGFRPTAQPDPFLFELEPEDIHMVRPL